MARLTKTDDSALLQYNFQFFIFYRILEKGFDTGAYGYLCAKKSLHQPNKETRKRYLINQQEKFRRTCNIFSKVGEHLIKNVWGSDNDTYKEWKEKRNFDQWISVEREFDF